MTAGTALATGQHWSHMGGRAWHGPPVVWGGGVMSDLTPLVPRVNPYSRSELAAPQHTLSCPLPQSLQRGGLKGVPSVTSLHKKCEEPYAGIGLQVPKGDDN